MKYLILAGLLAVVVLSTAASASAETLASAPSVVGLTPFTANANYMSLPGYLRYQAFGADDVWMTRLEAVRAVKAQGCDPTLSIRDMKVLVGRKGL